MRATVEISARRRQLGLTLILMLTILTLGTTYVLVQQMNDLAQRLGQDRASADVLMQAKQALIGYAAQYANRPGALPCPDLDNDGQAEDHQFPQGNCNQANERVGRFPWKTLRLPDLRDAAGERLWYALSDSLRDKGVVNSNSAGELTVYDGVSGAATATDVIAVIIAPGAELVGQNRSVSGVGTRDPLGATVASPARANVANYLEGRNNYTQDTGGNNDNAFVQPAATAIRPRGQCLILGVPSDCNDRLITITHNELFSVVENMVARRIETEIVPQMRSYHALWNAYPYAMPFMDPPESANLKGVLNTSSGLLPLTADMTWITWGTTPAPMLTVSGALFLGGNCGGTTANQVRCSITYCNGTPTVTITAQLQNVGMSFFTGKFSKAENPLGGNRIVTMDEPTHVLNSDGSDTVTYRATLQARASCFPPFIDTLTIEGPPNWPNNPPAFPLPLTTTLDPYNKWFIENKWYKLLLYTLAPGYFPAGGSACTQGVNCLTVNNSSPSNNKGVILTFAGRTIGSQLRLTSAQLSDLTNYFEGQNATPADSLFEQNPRSLAFNDKIVIVAP